MNERNDEQWRCDRCGTRHPWPPLVGVTRSALYSVFLWGALIGLGAFRWGHHFWPNFFALVRP